MSSTDPGAIAHAAAMRHITALNEALESEGNGAEIDWNAPGLDALAPYDGCDNCVVREVLHAGIESLIDQGLLDTKDLS